jgi:hypothetical protein
VAALLGLQLQVLLMSLLSLGLQLEDPFDTGPAAAPDTISLLEFNHTLSYVSCSCTYKCSDHVYAALAAGILCHVTKVCYHHVDCFIAKGKGEVLNLQRSRGCS